MDIDYQSCLNEIYEETKGLLGKGKVADYIPALAEVDPNQYGICVHTLEGQTYYVGDAKTPFSIQSISKVFVLSMVFAALGDSIWSRMGREPSGSSFNSLVLLETENGFCFSDPYYSFAPVSDYYDSIYINNDANSRKFIYEKNVELNSLKTTLIGKIDINGHVEDVAYDLFFQRERKLNVDRMPFRCDYIDVDSVLDDLEEKEFLLNKKKHSKIKKLFSIK